MQTGEDEKYRYFVAYFDGRELKIIQDKETNEVLLDADACMRFLGLGESTEEFLGTDKGLDMINEYKRRNPGKPVFGEEGLFRRTGKNEPTTFGHGQ